MSLFLHILMFIGAAIVIGFGGWRLAGVADRLADRTGLGEALTGAIFLGASTSLPGLVTSVTAAAQGYAELAVSNAIGGIAAQTVFLAIADIAYTRANLEHAAASATNILQGALLIALLAVPMLAMSSPEVALWGIHPATPVLIAGYLYGMRIVSKARSEPMWRPQMTPETQRDQPAHEVRKEGLAGLWLRFAALAATVAVGGWGVARSGVFIAESTGLSETAVGALFTAVTTSLPELVTAIAAVRQGALKLAVSDIIGGNAFDTLFLAVADGAYREGSIYHAVTSFQLFLLALSVLLTGILLMGLVRREKSGIANIGFESFLILVLYVGAMLFLFLA